MRAVVRRDPHTYALGFARLAGVEDGEGLLGDVAGRSPCEKSARGP
ncbi:hypothetical protein ACIOKD_21330 [Streptomyces sp. NPDC087844]